MLAGQRSRTVRGLAHDAPGSGAGPGAERGDGWGDADAPRRQRAARAGLALWLGALIVGAALFHAIGEGPLSAPPLDPAGWGVWADGRDPLVATFAVLRLLVLALSWYLVGATTVGILARVLRATSLVRIADALTVPALRRGLQAALGVSLATAMVTSVVPAPEPMPKETSTVMLRAVGADPGQLGGSGDAGTVPSTAVGEGELVTSDLVESRQPLPLELLERGREAAATGSEEISDRPRRGVTSGSDVTEPIGTARGAATESADDERLVLAGESFWTIAEDVLTAALDRVPTEAEAARYWGRLVEANRDRLADRDNPDLIFPGQALVIPADGATVPEAR
jgi:hypothetical protein